MKITRIENSINGATIYWEDGTELFISITLLKELRGGAKISSHHQELYFLNDELTEFIFHQPFENWMIKRIDKILPIEEKVN